MSASTDDRRANYLLHAAKAREDGAKAVSEKLRTAYLGLAEEWEQMADGLPERGAGGSS